MTGDFPQRPSPFTTHWTIDTTDWIAPNTLVPVQEIQPSVMIPLNYPIHNLPDYSRVEIEAIMSLLHGIKQGTVSPDPIVANPAQSVDRIYSPERPVLIHFDFDAIKLYEEDAGGQRHLRYTISYNKINVIQVVSENKFLSVEEVAALDLTAELRNTQASLFHTAEKLRTSNRSEIAIKDAQIKHLEMRLQEVNEERKALDTFRMNAEAELQQIKQQIADRKKATEHLELEFE